MKIADFVRRSKPVQSDLKIAEAQGGEELQRLGAAYPFPDSEIQRLKARRWILRYPKRGGIGAEVGVYRGHFSELLIDVLKPTKIYLVDPWTKLGEYFYIKGAYGNRGKMPTRVARREVELRTARFANVDIKFVEGYFLEEIGSITEKLDWIYIDATHKYEAVVKDLQAASTLLKPDGVILGDDWAPSPWVVHHGVFRAAQEFCRMTDYQVIGAGQGAQFCLRRVPKY
jgi:hypothetical protein